MRGRSKVVYWNNLVVLYMIERINAFARRDNLNFEGWSTERNAPQSVKLMHFLRKDLSFQWVLVQNILQRIRTM